MNLFSHALLVWVQHREFQAARAELDRYSDRELRDMGLIRRDITSVAYDEGERRVALSGNRSVGAWQATAPQSAL